MTTTTILHRDAVSDALYATLVHIGLTPYPDPLPLGHKGNIDSADHWQRVYHAQANARSVGVSAESVAWVVLACAVGYQEAKGVTVPRGRLGKTPLHYDAFFRARLLAANEEIEERIAYERANPDDSAW